MRGLNFKINFYSSKRVSVTLVIYSCCISKGQTCLLTFHCAVYQYTIYTKYHINLTHTHNTTHVRTHTQTHTHSKPPVTYLSIITTTSLSPCYMRPAAFSRLSSVVFTHHKVLLPLFIVLPSPLAHCVPLFHYLVLFTQHLITVDNLVTCPFTGCSKCFCGSGCRWWRILFEQPGRFLIQI